MDCARKRAPLRTPFWSFSRCSGLIKPPGPDELFGETRSGAAGWALDEVAGAGRDTGAAGAGAASRDCAGAGEALGATGLIAPAFATGAFGCAPGLWAAGT